MANGNSNNLKQVRPLGPMGTGPGPVFQDEQIPIPPMPMFQQDAPIDMADLEARLNALLQPAAAPAQQPLGFGGVAKGLLAALPQAIAVLLSKDPAQTLQKQIENLQAMQFQREEAERVRRERLEEMKRTVGIDLVRGEMTERRATAREKRQFGMQVSLTKQEQEFKQGERESAEKAAERLAKYDVEARRKLQESQQTFTLQLQKLADERDDLAKYVTQREKHRAMGIPDDVAVRMARSDVKGQAYDAQAQKYIDAITLEEKEFKTTARKLELSKLRSEIAQNLAQAAAARASAASKSKLGEEMEWVAKQQWGLTADGRMVLLDKMAKDPAGTYIDEKGAPVVPIDSRKAQGIYLMREGQKINKEAGEVKVISGAEKKIQADNLDAQIGAYKSSPTPPSNEQIARSLRANATTPQDKEAAEDAITRNNLESRVEAKKSAFILKLPIGAKGGVSTVIDIPIATEGPYGAIGRSLESGSLGQIGDAFRRVPTATKEAFETMFRKNTPEENQRLLEEARKRFGPTPTPTPKQ